ncbi:5-methyltetrahydropteroyltriglutamate--homocysteine S-methyltransferase [Thalassotalea sp. 1_MG-2023]|uniref:5-methyltetrahydropteroyltriglutamate-- homocysteine S-methyltransferase n=1 Tax=Thalassotalea sp. 1_MG-2023 TaxID=3062680 RepID=UPI0026E18C49|nr:5-methyltetrahydropteroyltriglutamate--homocysteine S-methyltransferase [Thalassotalea sp. 1_MG-2023]MDO6426190.1 5-methyltetrahydropteroyltriglutamate--homocysteine S-methyltransferase [Thalassotalea sp. 1_MG-2023]
MRIHNLGFPRIGKQRELKFALEAYWQNNISQQELLKVSHDIRKENWLLQAEAGVDLLPVGDFVHYDHVLTTSLMLGVIPERFSHTLDALDLEFQIARGKSATSCGCAASDMTKWFDTNYHYLVPELAENQTFTADASRLQAQINQAKTNGYNIKPVILGPVTYLYLAQNSEANIKHLPKLLEAYNDIFLQIAHTGVEWVQIDEPILSLEIGQEWQQAIKTAYQKLQPGDIKCLLTTYFGSVEPHIDLIASLPVHGLHVDTVAEPFNVQELVAKLPNDWVISLGVVDGRNIWKSHLSKVYQWLNPLYQQFQERLWIAPSCSLLHSPVDLESEQSLNTEIQQWLAFAKQKCQELALLKTALLTQNTAALDDYSKPVNEKLASILCRNAWVERRVDGLAFDDYTRNANFEDRKKIQQKHLDLPLYPTTTIGSFPQTKGLRKLRSDWRKGTIDDVHYQESIFEEIKQAVQIQEDIGLDVLVHGEAERNDMVEYFGEQLEGVTFTRFGWVQSYGSRCVKPPIIYGDVARKQPMTTTWLTYAQSLTQKPVKAMLTGPITILSWSFVREDKPRATVAKQIALAIADEVTDLENAGLNIIQIDEPAIREAMPLKKSQWQQYFNWATKCFRLTVANAKNSTQIHTHMCYSEFNEILPAISSLDADVITIETSRSNMALLGAFEQQRYPNDIGPGVYDIHSPNVPTVDWIKTLINKAEHYIEKENIWVNPDCGLKTRQWQETKLALKNMVTAAQELRQES